MQERASNFGGFVAWRTLAPIYVARPREAAVVRPNVSDVPQLPGLIVSFPAGKAKSERRVAHASSLPSGVALSLPVRTAAQRDGLPPPKRGETIAWGSLLTITSSVIAGGLLVVSLVDLGSSASPLLISLLAAISAVIAVASWLRLLLSMNRVSLSLSSLWCGGNSVAASIRTTSLFLFLVSGVCYLAAALAIMTQSPYVQFAASFVASVLSWISFVIIFNENYSCPSREQFGALFQIVLLSILWEVRAYLTNSYFHD